MKRRDLIKHLRDYGCKLHREGGKHSIWRHPDQGTHATVPRHRRIDNNLAKQICKQLKIPPI
ncbi:type II toxin-antitoxin system HicA family toxin [Candidatus Poribacteria bacterium]|nr:type II toxin-antitoxin system HicA family toxin [Candidatus Poribacteria bacterium]